MTDEFMLKRLPGRDDEIPRSLLLRRGQATGQEIAAALLDAVIETPAGFLLLTTDDVPFEEFLGIQLLDLDLNLVDSARIGAACNAGSLAGLNLMPPDHVQFEFIGDFIWSVRVLDKPVLRTPFNAEPRGVHRGLRLTRHFTVESRPKLAARA